ncbi:MAG: acetate/propionate family kinase [Candidatus Binatia bacterium]
MTGAVLVLNAGSSSIKFARFDVGTAGALEPGPHGEIEAIGGTPRLGVRAGDGTLLADRPCAAAEAADHRSAIATIRAWLHAHPSARPLAAVGHRVVHGGREFAAPVRVDAAVLATLERLVPLAPLHQPHNLAAIRAVTEATPDVPQVACFDTAFHRTQPPVAQAFALPRRYADEGVRRYGFHGLSYEYVASVLPGLAPGLASARVVVAHLGNGASMCALRAGRSVATTMGFTAVDGLPMGTRTGALDPGAVLHLLDHHRLDARALERLLYHESGLLGVSGISSDMRTLLASDDPHAREAIDLFVYRIGRELGSLAAALGGLDALVFTGGIGEHAAPVRARVCRDAAWLGIRLDEAANAAGGPCISTVAAAASAWVVPTDENLMIARHTVRVLGG